MESFGFFNLLSTSPLFVRLVIKSRQIKVPTNNNMAVESGQSNVFEVLKDDGEDPSGLRICTYS